VSRGAGQRPERARRWLDGRPGRRQGLANLELLGGRPGWRAAPLSGARRGRGARLHGRGPHGERAQAVAGGVAGQLHQHVAAVRPHARRQLRLRQLAHLAARSRARLGFALILI